VIAQLIEIVAALAFDPREILRVERGLREDLREEVDRLRQRLRERLRRDVRAVG